MPLPEKIASKDSTKSRVAFVAANTGIGKIGQDASVENFVVTTSDPFKAALAVGKALKQFNDSHTLAQGGLPIENGNFAAPSDSISRT